MNDREYVIHRETPDWVALEMHRWDRKRLGTLGWALSILAWLYALMALSGASLWTAIWVAETRKGKDAPLGLAETGAVVLAETATAGLLILPTIPRVRRSFATERARKRVRRFIKAGKLHPGAKIRVRFDEIGLSEVGETTDTDPLVISWASIRQVARTDKYLFAGAGDRWVVVPAREFADEANFLEFCGSVREHVLAVTGP